MVNNDKYFYAIKVGKKVENIVVNSWKISSKNGKILKKAENID